jgi:hypothetical protein
MFFTVCTKATTGTYLEQGGHSYILIKIQSRLWPSGFPTPFTRISKLSHAHYMPPPRHLPTSDLLMKMDYEIHYVISPILVPFKRISSPRPCLSACFMLLFLLLTQSLWPGSWTALCTWANKINTHTLSEIWGCLLKCNIMQSGNALGELTASIIRAKNAWLRTQ